MKPKSLHSEAPHGKTVPIKIHGEPQMAFVPGALSSLPAPDWGQLMPELGRANRAVGALRRLHDLLPDPDRFLAGCVRREALYSSQVEGTQSSLDELLLAEDEESKPGKNGIGSRADDRAETSNYVKALNLGIAHLRAQADNSLPLSLRLLRRLHEVLLQSGRGAQKGPGEFRRIQNWIGDDYMHIPPPPNEVENCMTELENFIVVLNNVHNTDNTAEIDPLIRAGMAHAQFETIHPFLDGNGRVGRLLIVLMLINEGVLDDPWLYFSLPIKKSRPLYYQRLQSTRTSGDWTGWLLYFLRMMTEAAEDAEKTAREVDALFRRDAAKITEAVGLQSPAPLAVHKALQALPISSIRRLQENTGFSAPAIKTALDRLIAIGIARPFDGRTWGRRFVYHAYMEILRRDSEPL